VFRKEGEVKSLAITLITLSLLSLLLGACVMAPVPAAPATETQPTAPAIANPASENCVKQGGTLEIREDPTAGGEVGYCKFADGSECEEWALMRGECQPGAPAADTPVAGMPNPASVNCTKQGGTLEIRKDPTAGGEVGYCKFADGSECEEWALMRGECQPGWSAGAGIANPASANCAKEGGAHAIETRGDGGQYGVCLFDDNRQCEEWALMRGECPAGGLKVTGYVTPAARYCAITGGTYAVTANSGQDDEQGTCTFVGDSQCDAWDYYNGKCDQVTAGPAPTASATIQPLPVEVCNGQAQAMAHALDVLEVTQSEAPLTDPVTGAAGTGCQATVTGTGEQFESPDAVVKTLGSMLEEQGWTADPMLAAGGPNAIDEGYRKDDQICWAGAGWQPDASANCPKDQPVSACQVTPAQQDYTITLNCGVETAQAQPTAGMPNPASVNCTKQGGTLEIRQDATGGEVGYCKFADGSECEEWALMRGECRPGQAAGAGIANPASENCVKQGGTLSIETRGDGGEYGICVFEDNLQCEEWALMRGDCPAGGVKVTGYVTPAAQYCAITGGEYAVTGNSGAEDEQGTCTFKDGGQCDAWDYYNGKCDASTASAAGATASAATAAVTATVAATSTATTTVPLKDAVAGMDPQDVWQNFYDLTQIPRPSHHEEQVRDFLAQFGKDLGLETIVDEVGNVIIRKPASPGMEKRHGVILQAHMDMVPQKTPTSTHDFLTDPIDAYVEGDWVKADGTTLGADDGSGVAIAMAILQSKTLALGPLEALFTVNEEDGMSGALGLQSGELQGDTLINLDSENEGEFTIGSAGGNYGNIDASYEEVPTPDATAAYTVTVSGLKGGHSGVDIDKGRGHATKLLVRLLSPAAGEYGVRLAQIAGGTAANAITPLASALVVVPTDQVDAFLQYVQEYEGIIQAELAAVEPDLKVQTTAAALPAQVMDEEVQRMMIAALYGMPQGVMRMSDAVPDLVETSTNTGIVKAADGQFTLTCYPRSSVDTELDDINQMITSVWDLIGVEVAFSGRFPGWNPNPDSPILLLMQDTYKEMYGQDPAVSAIHAGLECGTIVGMYPGMDAISIGPTLHDVHTVNERIQVSTVKKLNDFLLETLQRIPEK
jgi:dipeptidase D